MSTDLSEPPLPFPMRILEQATRQMGREMADGTDENMLVRPYDERAMRVAISEGEKQPRFPFGCLIVDETSDREMVELMRGHNNEPPYIGPIYHGETTTIAKLLRKTNGKVSGRFVTLYTTGEPCAMCASAIEWTGNIHRICYGTSIEKLTQYGYNQIQISTSTVIRESFRKPPTLVRGAVLEDECNALFERAQRIAASQGG
mmetsp:Transcript_54014/g.135783  ORF Transcript_54014/g.135783 Transcript_54014/m.135783 type:complete len:202 (-) Transcript_54014:391-996(-)